jgi:hypothetical protein
MNMKEKIKERSTQEKRMIMKNRFKILALVLTLGLIFGLSTISIPQPPPPSDHGDPGDVPGGTAPVGSGLVLLIGMGAAYGSGKLYKAWKTIEE